MHTGIYSLPVETRVAAFLGATKSEVYTQPALKNLYRSSSRQGRDARSEKSFRLTQLNRKR